MSGDRLTLTEACGIHEKDGGLPLSTLIDSWCYEVLRFFNELPERRGDPAVITWNIYDLVGSYYTRDRIDALLVGRGLPPNALDLADEVLRSFTVERDFNWSSHTGESGGAGWWWRRIPSSGPVAQQISGWPD